jgi:hypothetical protein
VCVRERERERDRERERETERETERGEECYIVRSINKPLYLQEVRFVTDATREQVITGW